jgi:hypothetical protein
MANHDPVLARLDTVDRAAQDLHAELSTLRDRNDATRRLRAQGHALSEALVRSRGPASHEVVALGMARLTQAVHEYRCAVVRHLVDTEGWSLSDVAARTGNARQVVSRLYHACDDDHAGACPQPKFQLRPAQRAVRAAR